MLRALPAFAVGLALLAPASIRAHVRLTYPAARYPAPDTELGQQNKDPPCGVAGDARPSDSARLTVLEPGQTLDVQFRETIDHPGFFRISFDDDGQDAFVLPTSLADVQEVPALPVLVDNIADGPAGAYSVQVTLPDVECEGCTLQLMQVMLNEPEPPWTVVKNLYFQCADIALRRPSVGASGAAGMASSGAPGAEGGGGASMAGSVAGAGAGPVELGGNGGSYGGGATSSGAPFVASDQDPGVAEGSCALAPMRSAPSLPAWLLPLLALGVVRRWPARLLTRR
jgi:hypothetical protein